MDFNDVHTRTARKHYRCAETGAPINPGQRYTEFVGTYEGDFYRVKMLPQIARMYDRLNAAAWKRGDEGIQFGALSEEVFENLADDPTPERIADAEVFVAALPPGKGQWMREALAAAKAGKGGAS